MDKFILTDGAKSADLLTSDDPSVWNFLSGRKATEDTDMLFRVAAAYRAFHLKANTVSGIPFILYKGDTEFDISSKWENKVGFLPNPKELFRLGMLSLMFTNSIYNIMTSDKLGYKVRGLYNAIPATFDPVANADGTQLEYIERRIGTKVERYKPDGTGLTNVPPSQRLVYMWHLDHTTELLPSEYTDARAVMNAAGIGYSADVWIRHFFERGGVAPTVIGMKGAVIPDTRETEEKSWDSWLRGLGRWRARIARVFNAETLDVKQFGSAVTDLKENQVYRQALENIALGTGIPITRLLSNAANYATADKDDEQWYRDDIIPISEWLAYEYNEQVFEPMGLRLEFTPEVLEPMQKDEAVTAGALSAHADAFLKFPTYEVWRGYLVMLGNEIPDELDAAAKKYYAEKEKRDEEMRENMQVNQQEQNEVKPASQPVPTEAAETPKPKTWTPSLDELEELRRWREISERRLRQGKSLDYEYKNKFVELPGELTGKIKAALVEAKTGDDIKAAFELDIEAQEMDREEIKALMALADALNKTADKQPMNVNITTPQSFTLNEKDVTVTPELKAAPVVVNVPEQIPVVNITNEVETPEVTVNNEVLAEPKVVVMPDKKQKARVVRDSQGNVTGLEAE